MANPRKFSEKIALHNQKQAEETAAFDEVMREISSINKQPNAQQHLNITQPHLGNYRGGSLPNVNQMAANSIDLQGALHSLEGMKQAPGRQQLMDRMHSQRGRQFQGQRGPRAPFSFDNKRQQQIDCSPYGSAYLSPPPDTSWRRTSSDSALHTTAMQLQQQQQQQMSVQGAPPSPPNNRRIDMTDPSVQMVDGQLWDPKKVIQLAQSRPKSCEVPGINIYPSPEMENTGIHIPISNNTGSLPDLTNLHFPSPMTTPLDAEEQGNYTQANTGNLSPTSAHHIGAVRPTQQSSPNSRRRQPAGAPSPLILQEQMRHNVNNQQVSAVDGSSRTSDVRLHHQQYRPYHPTNRHPHGSPQQSLQINPANHSLPQQQQRQQNSKGATMTQYRNSTSECPASPTSPQSQTSYSPSQSPGLPPSTVSNSPFNDTVSNSPFNDTVSNSPFNDTVSNSPFNDTVSNSPFNDVSNFNDAYYVQQQTQQQTNALQHRFAQFNMLQENIPKTSDGNQCSRYNNISHMSNVQYSQANMSGLTGSQEFQPTQQQQQNSNYYQVQQSQSPQHQNPPQSPQQQSPQQVSPQQQMPSPGQISPDQLQMLVQNAQLLAQTQLQQSNKIPDIIFTGVDDQSRQDFAKELGNAMAGMSDAFDSELFPSDEALRDGLDPLDLEGFQMLTDPNLVTDPATEDSFRLDKL